MANPCTSLRPYGLLEVNNLRISACGAPHPTLAGVSCHLSRGQVGVVIGRSGVGKTLLMGAILGILPETLWSVKGNIRFRGFELLGSNGYDRAILASLLGGNIMAVFQEPTSHLHPSLSIGWQLREMWRPSSWRMSQPDVYRARSLLRDVALHEGEGLESSRKRPFQLSQGEQQRAMIAMALAGGGHLSLLLADEPTSALDEATESQIVRLLRRFREDRRVSSMLVITHNLHVLDPLLCSDDWVMEIRQRNGIGLADCPVRVGEVNRHTIFETCPARTPTPDVAPVLDVARLRVGFRRSWRRREVDVLSEVSLSVDQGEFFAIAGPSGIGKTTLAKALVGLVPVSGGTITYRPSGTGSPVELAANKAARLKCRHHIQMVFQDALSTFDPEMTIGETYRETLRYAGIVTEEEQDERILPLLESMGMARRLDEATEILHRLPSAFSGGQRQRLGVARTLILRPRVVVADEPFANQDFETARDMATLLRKLQEAHGITFLLISHDQRWLRRLCSNGVRLERRDGRVTATQWA